MNEFTCSKCDICNLNNHKPLLGDGNLDANIMFISRNPSKFEVKNDIPLINKDGMLFQSYLDLFNFNRDLIYVTNAVKCRTPGHRYPTDTEIYNCREYLELEIKRVSPKIIVLMGLTALRSYFHLAFTTINIHIDTLNAKYMIYNGRIIIFMIHPSYGLYSTANRIQIFNAFKTLVDMFRIINPGHTVNFNE